ncbi:hypothetical protein D6D17_09799 [Aureobasidium pullulans]|nr:hypothetical protein D6D17_09799 [Aureobasidium pullulans]THX86054.1 hypothetical protein D6D04_01604 [Aureobasidium pullulans]THY93287.1 hypothetical protein D6C92_05435 [Aureobasidium pullulans]THZ07717.1 hypothetical protein D6C95_01889 [Aureobasidium pullulans]TIA10435.1 hypothetical protein D6C81_08305 [Aureobasidium pullulans]
MSTSSTVTNNTADAGFKQEAYQNSPSTTTYDTDKIAVNEPRASMSTVGSADPRTQDIKSWKAGFQRMSDERLEKQRYQLSEKKDDEINTIALGAKVERALGRRMVGQDAQFTRRESLSAQTPVQPAQEQQAPVELPEKRSVEITSKAEPVICMD